jgi:hypothetical protein
MRFLKRLFGIRDEDRHNILAGIYPFLVTGCGRSGTHFTAKFLALNGLDMGHEATGAQGAVGWLCASPDFCRARGAVFHKTLHQIRHPVPTIASLQTFSARAWDYIFDLTPQCRHPSRPVAAARYWLHWNNLALSNAALSVRLEDFRGKPAETVAALSDFFGKRLDPSLITVAESYGDSRKSRRDYGHKTNLSEVRREDEATWRGIEALAARFGYDLAE